MPRGTRLNASEIKTALQLEREGLSVVRIAKLLNRSRCAIQNLLEDPENYGKRTGGGRPRAISERDRRAILRVASNSTLSAREIAAEAGVDTNIRNVQRLLYDTEHIKRLRLRGKPPLTERHKENRKAFALEHLRWKKRWRRVIFSDEKRFCLDGPDGHAFYFHDLRKDPLLRARRQMRGGGIMVWAGIGYNGQTNIKFISTKMNSQQYIEIINEELSMNGQRIGGENFIFQQDNAAVHTAGVVKRYFENKKTPLLDWPARSPDLNIIENVWGHLSRIVYRGFRQFSNIEDLKTAIEEGWNSIPRKYLTNLYKSLPNRMVEVIENNGGPTHY